MKPRGDQQHVSRIGPAVLDSPAAYARSSLPCTSALVVADDLSAVCPRLQINDRADGCTYSTNRNVVCRLRQVTSELVEDVSQVRVAEESADDVRKFLQST